MVKNSKKLTGSLCFLALLLILPQNGFTAQIPKSTPELLERFKLDPSILDGIDQELQLPKPRIERQKKRAN